MIGAGLADRLPSLEMAAQESLRQTISEPILYGTLKEVGLASLVEVVAFEFMLSRLASRISPALSREMKRRRQWGLREFLRCGLHRSPGGNGKVP